MQNLCATLRSMAGSPRLPSLLALCLTPMLLASCAGPQGVPTDRASFLPPPALMQPARKPEPIPEGTTLDQALGVTVRNAGRAAENAAQLDALENDIRAKAVAR